MAETEVFLSKIKGDSHFKILKDLYLLEKYDCTVSTSALLFLVPSKSYKHLRLKKGFEHGFYKKSIARRIVKSAMQLPALQAGKIFPIYRINVTGYKYSWFVSPEILAAIYFCKRQIGEATIVGISQDLFNQVKPFGSNKLFTVIGRWNGKLAYQVWNILIFHIKHPIYMKL
jgi:hypothetical protein